MKKIVVLISGDGSNLQALIDACQQGIIQAHISAVFSNRADAYGLRRAQQAGIPTVIMRRPTSAQRACYDEQLAQAVAAYQPNIVVLAGFMQILGPTFLCRFPGCILNIHPSLLPKYPGLNTHQRALAQADTRHGATVHFVTEQLDAGPIILQASVPLGPHDQLSTVVARVQQQERLIYPQVVSWFIDDRLMMKQATAWLDGKPLPISGYATNGDTSNSHTSASNLIQHPLNA